jgi:hypothetical protein
VGVQVPLRASGLSRDPSASLRISAADSPLRSAPCHARKTPQLKIRRTERSVGFKSPSGHQGCRYKAIHRSGRVLRSKSRSAR